MTANAKIEGRRSFLKLLGLGAAAAPLALDTARASVPTAPADPVSVTNTAKVGNRDPFHVAPDIIPRGVVYNWKRRFLLDEPDRDHMRALTAAGWRPVPASRHDGVFMPAGWWGNIEVGGLILMEKAVRL